MVVCTADGAAAQNYSAAVAFRYCQDFNRQPIWSEAADSSNGFRAHVSQAGDGTSASALLDVKGGYAELVFAGACQFADGWAIVGGQDHLTFTSTLPQPVAAAIVFDYYQPSSRHWASVRVSLRPEGPHPGPGYSYSTGRVAGPFHVSLSGALTIPTGQSYSEVQFGFENAHRGATWIPGASSTTTASIRLGTLPPGVSCRSASGVFPGCESPPPEELYTPEIELIDPVPDLLSGNAVSASHSVLREGGRPVAGVAADGVATLLLRIHAREAGETFTVSLPSSCSSANTANGCRDENGALGAVGSDPASASVTVTASGSPAIAVALYRAPVDFAMSAAQAAQSSREVTATVQSEDSEEVRPRILVLRPPVVLVHGLWSSDRAWDSFRPLVDLPDIFTLHRFSYEETNAAKVLSNAGRLRRYVIDKVDIDRRRLGVAIAQVDLVVHSMGGLLARSLSLFEDSTGTLGRGLVHKLITIGTPHLGSPLAAHLLRPENACVAEWMAAGNMPVDLGAIDDLSANLDGTGLSPALQRLGSVPTARLAGVLAPEQVRASTGALALSGLCLGSTTLLEGFLYGNLTPIMGARHDGVVPLRSALDGQGGLVWGDEVAFGGLHTLQLTLLGLVGPELLEQDSPVARQVLLLLNTPVTRTEFLQ